MAGLGTSNSCARTSATVAPNPDLTVAYQQFLALNEQFKELCGAWQIVKFNGERNDHSDAGYDAAVLENLAHLHAAAEPAVGFFGDVFDRMAPYGRRLESVLIRIQDGESNMFTGVMCGSYHDVWMELHEDLMLTQGIDRAREGQLLMPRFGRVLTAMVTPVRRATVN